MTYEEQIKNSIEIIHSGDKDQLEFIFSTEKRVLVEAAAGYGKTKSMISKIAYLIATKQVPNPKKILALTFSVNAAYKIKKDVVEQLPTILQAQTGKSISISNRIHVSNYHGFCRHILKLYGYLLHENLKNIDSFISIDDNNVANLTSIGVDYNSAKFLSDFNAAVKRADKEFVKRELNEYNQKVISDIITLDYIPYNAILSLTTYLFDKYPNVLSFYRNYFPVIIVDEFQDTNLLSFILIHKLISENTKTYFVGDSLQRIYGFIGAVPDLMNRVETLYGMKKVEFKQNYRFKNNLQMLLLDRNIRENAKDLANPNIESNVKINFNQLETQQLESEYIVQLIEKIQIENPEIQIAILFRNGHTNKNTQSVIRHFQEKGIDYFFALFTDEDENYIRFHKQAMKAFSSLIKNHRRLSKNLCRVLIKIVKEIYKDDLENPLINSLLQLLTVFTGRLFLDYIFLTDEDRITFLQETLENNALKQSVEFIGSKIIISTIHAAKGLEWDFVILPDCEQYSIPSWFGLCADCSFKANCNIDFQRYGTKVLDELSVFYVAVTRAKKDVYFSASKMGIHSNGNYQPRNVSCFLLLKGIEI